MLNRLAQKYSQYIQVIRTLTNGSKGLDVHVTLSSSAAINCLVYSSHNSLSILSILSCLNICPGFFLYIKFREKEKTVTPKAKINTQMKKISTHKKERKKRENEGERLLAALQGT